MRVLIVIAAWAILIFIGARMWPDAGAAATGSNELSAETRAATLRFAPDVTPADRAWILGAIQRARPEARRLIDEVDGLVTVRTDLSGAVAIGLAESGPQGMSVNFDVAALNGDRAIDRNVVVLHELGHIVDFVLADDALVRQLDAGIPPAGTCESTSDDFGACTAIEERFADTFAKWALRGRISLAGSGYGIPAPASIEDWGAPLGLLAGRLNAR